MTVSSSSSSAGYCHPLSSNAPLPDFTGHVLIVPVVSHACIPQLAVDLLINSPELKLQRVARLDATRDLIPFVGSDERGNGGITTSLEVYSDPSSKLTVIQQRSPVLKARKRSFTKRFTSWIRSQRFAQVLILSSVDNALRTEEEMNSQQALFRFIPVSSLSSSSSDSSSALLARLSGSLPELGRSPGEEEEKEEGTPIPSSSTGITRRLLADLTSPNSADGAAAEPRTHLPVGVLLLFAAEGDNRPDAHYLAGVVAELLRGTGSKGQAPSTRFAEPPSWAGLFGNGFDQALFG